MDPTTICCPNLACPARGQTGQGKIGIHARQDPWCIWQQCRRTCTATQGTVFSRLRPSAEIVVIVVTWLAQGCPRPAIVAAFGCDERTVAAWGARAGRPGPAIQAQVVEQPHALGQGQAEASRVKQQGGIVWLARAMMGSPRLWLAGAVGPCRDLTLRRRLMERGRSGPTPRPLWCCPDGWRPYIRAMREPCREPVHTGVLERPRLRPGRNSFIAQVVPRYAQRGVVAVERRRLAWTPARVETLRRRSPGHGVIHTAYLERLHATCRERLATLTRRGRPLARRLLPVQPGRSLLGTLYTFCPPHASLAHAGGATTPAMAAGITDHCWTVRALLSLHVPPPHWPPPKRRGRPSRALQRLAERWCA